MKNNVVAVAPCHLNAQVLNHSKNFSLKNHPLIIHHPCCENLTWNHHPKLKFTPLCHSEAGSSRVFAGDEPLPFRYTAGHREQQYNSVRWLRRNLKLASQPGRTATLRFVAVRVCRILHPMGFSVSVLCPTVGWFRPAPL
jgi:hypothetical protein